MPTTTATRWKPGTDFPYVLPLNDSLLAISLPAAWLKPDRSGQPLLLPPAIRALDRLRALFQTQQPPTPGFITTLRHALSLTQTQFGHKLGVSKMTISRWERGRLRPSKPAVARLRKLQHRSLREGVLIDSSKKI